MGIPPTAWEGQKKAEMESPTADSAPPGFQSPCPSPPACGERAQLVCGTCRQLTLFTLGAKYVRCATCQSVNLALAAHDVGTVNCGGCSVLLMYPYGAPKVKCSNCLFVTDIGPHNEKPPLSVQQSRPPPDSPVH